MPARCCLIVCGEPPDPGREKLEKLGGGVFAGVRQDQAKVLRGAQSQSQRSELDRDCDARWMNFLLPMAKHGTKVRRAMPNTNYCSYITSQGNR
jgi:hypothetical protein